MYKAGSEGLRDAEHCQGSQCSTPTPGPARAGTWVRKPKLGTSNRVLRGLFLAQFSHDKTNAISLAQ